MSIHNTNLANLKYSALTTRSQGEYFIWPHSTDFNMTVIYRMSIDSVRFVEIAKPYPKTIIANVTFKILRFIYPPFGHEALEVTYEVTLPDPDEWSLRACYICLSLLLLILSTCFVYKYFWRTVSQLSASHHMTYTSMDI